MTLEFQGTAMPLDINGIEEATQLLQVGVPELVAVGTVETRGFGYLPDRRPLILFERHIFSRETSHRFDGVDSNISNRQPGGYGPGGAQQYDRLLRAVALDREAALRSASWGLGQVMGFNAQAAGYADTETMVVEMMESENAQLLAMAHFINSQPKAAAALRAHDWAGFARVYNGADFAINKYDKKLAAAFQAFQAGTLPDLNVRTAQAFLTYLGFSPGTVDGLTGRLTRSALNEFREQNGLPIAAEVTEEDLAALQQAAIVG
ncbi:MAG: DUF3380 domain-containing protein [Acidobacteria bacterium]|nr:DUF3380 domain-containing protein [Acidobacteriota bacterium]MBI3425140.1 DUF3380 domain-containing protein [Acidobacteriota bacterium]